MTKTNEVFKHDECMGRLELFQPMSTVYVYIHGNIDTEPGKFQVVDGMPLASSCWRTINYAYICSIVCAYIVISNCQ